MKWIIVVFVFAFFMLLPQYGNCSKSVLQLASWEEQEYQKRQPVIERWLRALSAIAQKTNHPEAAEINDFLRFDSVIIVPKNKRGEIEIVRINNYSFKIGILPLLPEDNKLNSEWESLGKKLKGAKAVYLPGANPVIIINDVPLNDLWRGINLLHEGIVSAEILEKKAGVNPEKTDDWIQERAEIESSAWGFIADVMSSLSPDYQSVVKAEAERLRNQKQLTRPPSGIYNKTLNLLFGNPLSPFEEDLRETSVWVSAALLLIEEQNPDSEKAEKEKVKFFFRAIQNKGM